MADLDEISSSPESSFLDKDLWRKRSIFQVNGVWTVEGRPRTTYKILRIERPANIPGQVFIAVLITLPPNSATPPHSHNGAAVYGQVIKGRVISQMLHSESLRNEDGSTKLVEHDSGPGVYCAGEMWYEAPGCHHVRSENCFDEEATFFANFVIDEAKLDFTSDATIVRGLTILDIEL